MAYGHNVNNPDYKQFLRLAAISRPAEIFVFLDEHPDSISDGYGLAKADEPEWLDLPGSHHNGAGSFSFADGHSESQKRLEPDAKQPLRPDLVVWPAPISTGSLEAPVWNCHAAATPHPSDAGRGK